MLDESNEGPVDKEERTEGGGFDEDEDEEETSSHEGLLLSFNSTRETNEWLPLCESQHSYLNYNPYK